MDDSRQAEADKRFERALTDSGARDPRDYYRERLKALRGTDPEAYEKAVSYYQNTLIPDVASGEVDPLSAWRRYGLEIARLTAPGRTVAIDPTGKADPYEEPVTADRLILHLPEKGAGRALLVGLPPEPSPAQLATYDWLVGGRKGLRAPSPAATSA